MFGSKRYLALVAIATREGYALSDLACSMKGLRVVLERSASEALVGMLRDDLGTEDLERAGTYMEDPLRLLAHLVSTPEYQIV